MNKKSTRDLILFFNVIAFYSILIGALIIPIVFYYKNFKNHSPSPSATDWGAFGDYMGGIINPIIGFFSIVILGYISIKIGKNSTDEQKDLFISQQRRLAYQELIAEYSKFKTILANISVNRERLKRIEEIDVDKQNVDIIIRFTEYKIELNMFKIYLSSFGVKYHKLFDYDFESPKYTKVHSLMTGIIEILLFSGTENIDDQKIKKNNNAFIGFIDDLKSELN